MMVNDVSSQAHGCVSWLVGWWVGGLVRTNKHINRCMYKMYTTSQIAKSQESTDLKMKKWGGTRMVFLQTIYGMYYMMFFFFDSVAHLHTVYLHESNIH